MANEIILPIARRDGLDLRLAIYTFGVLSPDVVLMEGRGDDAAGYVLQPDELRRLASAALYAAEAYSMPGAAAESAASSRKDVTT
jgi:hypothetical protein